ncbi:unnamed protein product [Rhizophagus irregularis]|nr:unnamed protein product [Rhizophagus irregularis]
MYDPVVDVIICDVDVTTPLPYSVSEIHSRGISYRYICNQPLSSKLVKANKNVAQFSTNIKSKRSLFTAAYVITADAKIVQVIEGKDKKRDQVVPRICSTHNRQITVVSMKRFSFFEWTNVVVRERLHRNGNGKEKCDEDKINGPPKSSKDNNLKKPFTGSKK